MGHTSYYRKCIRHYSHITFPMNDILQKYVEFKWSQYYQESFKFLKKKLVKASILKFPNWSRKFHVHVDASNVYVGSVQSQPYDDTMDHPNVYASQKMNKAKINYSTTEREPLSLIFSLQKFCHYLLANPFTFYIDQQAMKYLFNKLVHQRTNFR